MYAVLRSESLGRQALGDDQGGGSYRDISEVIGNFCPLESSG